ncbi:hypothetical protein Tco_0956108 [Tanacetum coccineum]|uniref:Uncharacterized protein n=1 Tax=Tanacetum coccineum TaxID=301880 RepID=A0ABQ5E997_9ASTR
MVGMQVVIHPTIGGPGFYPTNAKVRGNVGKANIRQSKKQSPSEPSRPRRIEKSWLKSLRAQIVRAGVGRNLAGASNLDSEWSQPDLGTSSLQFQIPDLFTPQVFRGCISTPGGPSFTSPAPSSTPIGFGNCYTPTFDPETSKSGEQDDNGSDDGNHE